MKEFLLHLLHDHPGKVFGIGMGLIFGLIFILVGFWKTLILVGFIFLGYLVGVRLDREENLASLVRRIFGSRR